MVRLFMLTRNQKVSVVKELAEKLAKQKITLFADFRGISVKSLSALRRLLKKEQAEFKVAKKTLLDRALAEAGITAKTKDLEGQMSMTLGYGDPAAPAKTLVKFSRRHETFKLLGGVLEGKFLTAVQVIALAKLPGREVLVSQLGGILQAPLQGLVRVLQGNIKNLMVVLTKIKEQKAHYG